MEEEHKGIAIQNAEQEEQDDSASDDIDYSKYMQVKKNP